MYSLVSVNIYASQLAFAWKQYPINFRSKSLRSGPHPWKRVLQKGQRSLRIWKCLPQGVEHQLIVLNERNYSLKSEPVKECRNLQVQELPKMESLSWHQRGYSFSHRLHDLRTLLHLWSMILFSATKKLVQIRCCITLSGFPCVF